MRFVPLLVVGLLLGCADEAPPEPIIRPVRTIVPEASTGELHRTFRGAVQPSDMASLAFKVDGRIDRVDVDVGDVVSAGDVLAVLENTELQLQRSQAQANLTQAAAAARAARSALERVQALYVSNNASAADVDSARGNADASAAQVVAAARQRDLAAQRVADATLVAPRAGEVAAVRASATEVVGAGTPVVVVTSGDRLEAEFAVPGALISRVKRGMPVTVRITSDSDRASYAGHLTEVGVTASGGSYPVTALLDDDTPDLRAGLAAEIDIVFPAQDTSRHLVLPLAALGDVDGRRFVWIVESADGGLGTVARAWVQTGDWDADGVEITEGLSGSERVVTAGVSRIHEGQTVRVQDEAPQ